MLSCTDDTLINTINQYNILYHWFQISFLHPSLLGSNSLLRSLDFSHNLLTELPDNLVSSLHSLQSINVSGNLLSAPNIGLGYSYAHAINQLDFSYNPIRILQRGSFTGSMYWSPHITTALNFSYCGIAEVRPHVFRELRFVEEVSLAGMFIIDPLEKSD